MSIRTLSSREVYRNNWMRLREDEIERSNGERGIYAVVEKPPACIVVPLERVGDETFVYLVEQFRYTVGSRFAELPQGGWEMEEVDPEELARGELREETGFIAGKMTHLGNQWIAYGQMRQIHHVYLAEDLKPGETERDAEEHDLEVRRVSVREFERMIVDGEVMDNCSIAGWGLYKLWLERNR